MAVYFGGSRSVFGQSSQVCRVVHHALRAGHSVHVGCQRGADQAVIHSMLAFPSSLVVFAVSPALGSAPVHVQQAARARARVVLGAGGSSAPIPARYLLRSIAAFQGCESAVFFSPGAGSLAVARECISQGLPVFAFGECPAPVPSCAGQWVASQFMGFSCWQWVSAQLVLF